MTNKWTPRLRQHSDLLLFSVCVLFFLSFPDVDLMVTAVFYDNGFTLGKHPIVYGVYRIFADIHIAYLLALILLLAYFSFPKQRQQPKKRQQTFFLFLCLILGPGIFVNAVLKDNSLGRPRPVHTVNFGGEHTFTPVFHYSGACKKNCSFVSGHAAAGFILMALYWLRRNKKWLFAGILLGAFVGSGRIIQGGHYFSDVIFSGWAVYFVCTLLYRLFPHHTWHSDT